MWIKILEKQVSHKRLVSVMVVAALNISLLTFLIHLRATPALEASSYTVGAGQHPKVSVAAQENVPLGITIGNIDASNPLTPRVEYVVQNISSKLIRAYTVLEDTATKSSIGKTSTIVNITSVKQILQPYQSMAGTVDGQSYQEPLEILTLSIDFVEFADGTTWGDDTQQTAETLRGQRAGGSETIKKLRELMLKQGGGAVASLVKQKNITVVSPTPDQPAKWQYGFQVGQNTVLYRLKVALEKGGAAQLASELQKPFDASEGRQEK